MSDHGTLLRGTIANVIGLAFGVAAAFGVQLLLGRRLPAGGLSLVTVAVQVAFVASAGSRFGMDMTAIRRVAIDGADEHAAQLRSLVDRAAGVAAVASVTVAVLVAAGALLAPEYRRALVLASLSIPFIACANVYLGATRGLKRMTPTLWVFWIGQPVVWIAAAAIGIALGGSTDWAVLAYGISWVCATVAARIWWRRLSLGLGSERATPEQLREALRYGLPRAPSALLAQSLFWADLFVLGFYASGRPLDAYAAAGRVSQVVLLFLTSVSLIFSPFAADLHARGETARLDRLFKDSTRWALAATLPVLIILFVEAGDILRAFGPGFGAGTTQLRIYAGRPGGERRHRQRRRRAGDGRAHGPGRARQPGRQRGAGGRGGRAGLRARAGRRRRRLGGDARGSERGTAGAGPKRGPDPAPGGGPPAPRDARGGRDRGRGGGARGDAEPAVVGVGDRGRGRLLRRLRGPSAPRSACPRTARGTGPTAAFQPPDSVISSATPPDSERLMRVLILGGDGYLGWPTAMRFSGKRP